MITMSKVIFATCFIGISGWRFLPKDLQDKNLQVKTDKGIVQGHRYITSTGERYWAYQGIPFAQPPIEELRFRAPVPSLPWKGILNGTAELSSCVGIYFNIKDGIYILGEEDCLYLNIYTPQNPINTHSLKPVLVWIYGGGFMLGNSSSILYGPDNFLEKDVIVVLFNYRVGMFGFLSTGDLASPGNYGLKDQLLALKWIHRNIKNFGGDPKKVTLAGESAGAVSVFHHLVSPKSKGLFQRVIANSGTSLCNWAIQLNPRETAFDIGLAAGIETRRSEELITALRSLSVNELKEASRIVVIVLIPQVERNGLPFAPTFEPDHEEAFLTKNTFEALRTGDFHRVPVMLGMNTMESNLFITGIKIGLLLDILYEMSPGSRVYPSMNIKSSRERSLAGLEIKKHYFDTRSFDEGTIEDHLNLVSDQQYLRPITKTIKLISKYIPVYFYIFSYESNYGLSGIKEAIDSREVEGVAHSEELWYIWKPKDFPLPNAEDFHVISMFVTLYTNFIKAGNPTPERMDLLQNISWPVVNSNEMIPFLEIGSKLSIGHNFRGYHVKFWDKLYKKYGHGPYTTY